MAAPLPISGRQKIRTVQGPTSSISMSEQPLRLQQKNNLSFIDTPTSSVAPSLAPSAQNTPFGSQPLGPTTSSRRWADYTPAGVNATPTPASLSITTPTPEQPTASVIWPNTPTPMEYNSAQGLSFSQIMSRDTAPSTSASSELMSVADYNAKLKASGIPDVGEPVRNGQLNVDSPPGMPAPHELGQQVLSAAFAPGLLVEQEKVKVKNTFIDDYDSDEDGFVNNTHELGAKSLPVGLVRTGVAPGTLPPGMSRVSAQAATAAVLNQPPGQILNRSPVQSQILNQPPGHIVQPLLLVPPGQNNIWQNQPNRQPATALTAAPTGAPVQGQWAPMTVAYTQPAAPAPVQTTILPYEIRQPQPSSGSKMHGTGECRPCAWFWKPQGCANGIDCRHCHMCPEGELKNRKKDKVATMRNQPSRH